MPSSFPLTEDHRDETAIDEDVGTLVESARDEALMERRRWNLVVDNEPSFFVSRTGERLDMLARGLLSRVLGVGVVLLYQPRFHSSVRLLCL